MSERKSDYVRRQPQTRPHQCHWPGCKLAVAPAVWGCRPHWFALPRRLRIRIWTAYRPGQEEDLDVSEEYLAAAAEVQKWIEKENP